MLPPLPILSDYGISPEHGFLPAELPLDRLPDPYYNKWEAVIANLQSLILTKRLRGVIDGLPILSTAGLEHDSEWRRAYSMLCFMAHGYIWGGDTPAEVCRPFHPRASITDFVDSTSFDFSAATGYLLLSRSTSGRHILRRLPLELQTSFPSRRYRQPRKSRNPNHLHWFDR